MTRVLVVASTFPSIDSDPVPAFVRDQIIAMKKQDAALEFFVLAPHDRRSRTRSYAHHEHYDEYRFHYAWPAKLETLAGRGIMPALQANPLNYLLILPLFIGEFIALFRLTKQLKPDVIYAHWFTPQAITASWVGSLTKISFAFTTHASDVSVWRKIPFIGPFIVHLTASRAAKFTAVSQRSMDKLASFFSSANWSELQQRSAIIPMGIDIQASSQPQHQQAAPEKVLFIGRLAEKKGVQYLLPAFAEAQKQVSKLELTIAGDGPWLEKLKSQAASLDIPSGAITFAGYVTGNDKQSLLASHSVYVVPSIITSGGDTEGLPVSLMEGLAAGKVCIATNESGADNIITNNADGFLVEQKNTDALRDAILKAVQLDDTTRGSIAKHAIKTAQQFAWPDIAKKHIDFLFMRSPHA